IMLQWHTGNWMHRAYWGDSVIPWGNDNTTERKNMGPLPRAGEWVRLEVDAAAVGIKPGQVIQGWAFTQHDGTVYWDKAGIVTQTPQDDTKFDILSAWLRVQEGTKGANLPKPIADVVKLDAAKRNDAQKKQLRDYFVENVSAKTREVFGPLHAELSKVDK